MSDFEGSSSELLFHRESSIMEYMYVESWPSTLAVAYALAAASTGAIALLLLLKWRRSQHLISPSLSTNRRTGGNTVVESVLQQLSQKDRLRLQSQVANAKSAEDFYTIFDNFDILHNLKLGIDEGIGSLSSPNGTGVAEKDRSASVDQAFRDLVRDKIMLNDQTYFVSEDHAANPVEFRKYFHRRIVEIIHDQCISSKSLLRKQWNVDNCSEIKKAANYNISQESEKQLATHLCCHLARTRAGGDTFFCVNSLFESPQVRKFKCHLYVQCELCSGHIIFSIVSVCLTHYFQLVIIASHTDTHPPTELHTSTDGWAFITTTRFSLYILCLPFYFMVIFLMILTAISIYIYQRT